MRNKTTGERQEKPSDEWSQFSRLAPALTAPPTRSTHIYTLTDAFLLELATLVIVVDENVLFLSSSTTYCIGCHKHHITSLVSPTVNKTFPIIVGKIRFDMSYGRSASRSPHVTVYAYSRYLGLYPPRIGQMQVRNKYTVCGFLVSINCSRLLLQKPKLTLYSAEPLCSVVPTSATDAAAVVRKKRRRGIGIETTHNSRHIAAGKRRFRCISAADFDIFFRSLFSSLTFILVAVSFFFPFRL
ncbi:hypothetical protein CBL_10694 [Carabus blaptoides fortunei]